MTQQATIERITPLPRRKFAGEALAFITNGDYLYQNFHNALVNGDSILVSVNVSGRNIRSTITSTYKCLERFFSEKGISISQVAESPYVTITNSKLGLEYKTELDSYQLVDECLAEKLLILANHSQTKKLAYFSLSINRDIEIEKLFSALDELTKLIEFEKGRLQATRAK